MERDRKFSGPSMSDYVAANLKEEILSLSIQPGGALAEAEVARRYGVSTTPVREALQKLSRDGLVVLSRYRGATVVNLTEDDVREIYQLRESLEPLAIRLSVPRFTDEDISTIEDLLAKAEGVMGNDDLQDLGGYNRSFHGVFIARCGNQRLRQMLENLQEQNRIIALRYWQLRGFDKREHEEHRSVFQAVRQRDGERGAELLRQHIVRFGDAVVQAWSECCEGASETHKRLGDR